MTSSLKPQNACILPLPLITATSVQSLSPISHFIFDHSQPRLTLTHLADVHVRRDGLNLSYVPPLSSPAFASTAPVNVPLRFHISGLLHRDVDAATRSVNPKNMTHVNESCSGRPRRPYLEVKLLRVPISSFGRQKSAHLRIAAHNQPTLTAGLLRTKQQVQTQQYLLSSCGGCHCHCNARFNGGQRCLAG